MLEYLKSMLSNDPSNSSARAINVMGAVIATALMAYDTFHNGKLDSTNLGLFLSYCGVGYGVSKTLDKVGV
jgi:hypothetical protein